MDFKRLPSNSEKLLSEIIHANNPIQVLCSRFENATQQEGDELRGIIRELHQEGYIDVKWADNVPCFVTFNNSAVTYNERLAEYDAQKEAQPSKDTNVKKIFISHQHNDEEIAGMLLDFFTGIGIPKDVVFCSSLPGNDVRENIPAEVKDALKSSVVNIAILSQDYYKSTYCLNEAGIFWYQDVQVILIALPEIKPDNMYGFLDNNHKLYRLDCDTDISSIYDIISDKISFPHTKITTITHETNKLNKKYEEFIKNRESSTTPVTPATPVSTYDINIGDLTSDDERVVLYYILSKNVRKASKSDVSDWLFESEIHNINVDNAFDLLSAGNNVDVSNSTLELSYENFRSLSKNRDSILSELEKYVEQHTKLAVTIFKKMWDSDEFDHTMLLFISYIVDEKIGSFGYRHMADGQVKSIEEWERKYVLDSVLSSNYGNCIDFFIRNKLVYRSDNTSYLNPREYTLFQSLQDYLFNCPAEIIEKLQEVKEAHQEELPF